MDRQLLIHCCGNGNLHDLHPIIDQFQENLLTVTNGYAIKESKVREKNLYKESDALLSIHFMIGSLLMVK